LRDEPKRRPVLPITAEASLLEDLTGCVLAESGSALVSKLIRLKQIDGLNHNAVVVGPAPDGTGEWMITEAIAEGCVISRRRLSVGYVIRFDDTEVRRRIADSARAWGEKGYKYDYSTIAWHVLDFLVWALPTLIAVAAVPTVFSSRLAAGIVLLVAVVANPALRLIRWFIARMNSATKMICSELTLAILTEADVTPPTYLLRSKDYTPTPIDVTRWLMGRNNWSGDQPTGRALRSIKRVLGVRYRTRIQGPESAGTE
jgi:hypothetical protein